MPEAFQALFLLADFAFEPVRVFEPVDFADFELRLADLLLLFDFELCFAEALLPDLAPDFCLAFRLVQEPPLAVALSLVRLELAAASCLRPPLSLTPAPVAKALPLDLEPLSRKTIHYRNGSCTL